MKARLLVVDGNALTREHTRSRLCNRYDVKVAGSGQDALRQAGLDPPDLVLLDAELPGATGFDVCRRLRKDTRLHATKIALAIAQSSAAERVRAYQAGADDCIQKPFDDEELAAKVGILVRLKSAEEVSQLKDELLYLVAHEIRTPLTGAMSGAELLAGDAPLDEADRRMLAGIMQQSCRRLLGLAEDGLLLSRLRANLCPIKLARCSLATLAAEAAELCRPLAAERLLALELAVASDLAVDADPDLLRVLLRGMLENAVMRSDGDGAVRLQAERNAYGTSLLVAHRGAANNDLRNWDLQQILQAREVDGVKVGASMAEALISAIAEAHGAQLRVDRGGNSGREHFVECRLLVRAQVVGAN